MSTTPAPTVHHPLFARFYGWVSPRMERGGFGERRHQLLAGLAGRVVEVGAGNGMSFSHYPPEVTHVLAVEPEAHLRGMADDRATRAPVPVEVVDGTAEQLPAGDAGFDAAVVSLVLCTVPDPDRALAEIRRVLRPGGELRFFEHVRSETPLTGWFQTGITPLWSLAGGGCRLNRDTAAAIRTAGFIITEIDRFHYAPLRFVPKHAHILGRATSRTEGTTPNEEGTTP